MEKLRKFPKISERSSEKPFYAFGMFRIDPQKRLFLCEGNPISMTPKDFDLLLLLVEHRGEVMTKEELMMDLWPDTVVEEGNLNRNVSTLRKTLGESPDKHEFIVTVPGSGYRFVAGVREIWEDSDEVTKPLDRISQSEVSPGLQSLGGPKIPLATVTPVSPEGFRPARNSRGLSVRWGWSWPVLKTIVALAAIALIFVGARATLKRSKPILNSTDLVLVTDFVNKTNDPAFDDTLTQGVAVELAQSPFVNIVSQTKIQATLKLMARPSDVKLTPEVARELCLRTNAKVYIAGSIASLASQYVISLSAADCSSGDTLAQQQVTAENKEHVLKALDQAAQEIRRKLGESLTTLQKFDRPLEEATTSSLEALKSFSLGNLARDKTGDAATIPFYQRAIELDPSFALAYSALGISYSNLDEPGLASVNIAKAYELRGRVSEREKFEIAADYSQIVTGELERANQVSTLWAQTYPRDEYPHNILGINYEFLGQYEKAVREMLQAIQLNPDGVILRSDLIEDYIALGQLDEAKNVYRMALEHKLDHPYLHADRYGIAFLEGDRPEMDRQIAWASEQPGGEDFFFALRSDTKSFYGNLREAREFSRRAIEFALRNNQHETAALWRVHAALREAEFGDFERSRKDTAQALAGAPTRDVQILAALASARAGDSIRAKKIGDGLSGRFPLNTVINGYWLPTIRAAMELNDGRPDKAIDALRAGVPYEMGYPNPQVGVGRFLYPIFLRGQAYLRLGQGDNAAKEFAKFRDHRSIVENCPLGVLAQLGLARAYGLQSDTTKARAAYQDLFEIWKAADPDFYVLRQAKDEYAKLH